jgi:hypothetical protein
MAPIRPSCTKEGANAEGHIDDTPYSTRDIDHPILDGNIEFPMYKRRS